MVSLKLFVALTLATSILSASQSGCADESVMPNLPASDRSDEYLKPRGHIEEKRQRSPNPTELWQWGSNTIRKGQAPRTYKIPQLMPRLPLRFGRSWEEERGAEPIANLPLRFGRNFDGGISRLIPNLPQRFGRAAVKSVKESILHLPQRLLELPSAEQSSYPLTSTRQELQAAAEGEARTLDFDVYFTKKTDDNEVSPEEWVVWTEASDPKAM